MERRRPRCMRRRDHTIGLLALVAPVLGDKKGREIAPSMRHA